MNIHEKLALIQTQLHAPKNKKNQHMNFKFRNCEDIMEAAKPYLVEQKCTIVVSDDLITMPDVFEETIYSRDGVPTKTLKTTVRSYIKATATFSDGEGFVHASSYAREALDKKGLDVSQVTGLTASYARKYALGGLLLIDDNKDADSSSNSDKGVDTKLKTPTDDERLKKIMGTFDKAEASIKKCDNLVDLAASFEKVETYYKPNIGKFKAVKEFMDEISKIRDSIKLKITEKQHD